MLWLIVLTIVLATIVLLYVFCLRTGQSSSPAPSAEKESAEGVQISTDANQSNPNVFKTNSNSSALWNSLISGYDVTQEKEN
uniref:Uncharacterized protein n=1 Tax=Globodera pallida TaxID=36090 RepID=A0A183BW56_GLOPA